jgi:hypothetical protein
MRALLWACLTATILGGGKADAFPAFRNRTVHLQRCIDGLAQMLPDSAAEALRRIDGNDRRLLALRSYLRNRSSLEQRWSWSPAQIASYQRSAEFRAVQAELAKIASRFAQSNPGYALYVNTQVRSLDTQIARWNENTSVAEASRELEKAVKVRFQGFSCNGKDRQPHSVLAGFLETWHPSRTPTLAAPGLSRHGQARAFDFQIKRGDKVIAGTDSSTSVGAWDRHGWTQKLQNAVRSAGDRFVGPLQTPYEPWHYEYNP